MFSIANTFKKFVILVICLSMITMNFGFVVSAQDNANLIDEKNSSCENLEDFLVYENREPEKGDVGREISTDYVHSGDGSLKVTLPGNYRTLVGFKPTEDLVEGQEYTFTIWYYNPNNITGNLHLRYAFPSSIGGWISGTAHDFPGVIQNGGWHKYKINFTASAELISKITYFYVTTTCTSGTLYFDDITLTKKDESAVGMNLFDEEYANCETINNFNIYEYPEPDKGEVGREIDTDFYHSGDSSLKLTIPGSFRTLAGIAPSESLIANKEYTFSVWYYGDNMDGQSIYLRYASPYGHGNWVTGVTHDSKTAMESGKWTKFTYNFTATSKMVSELKYLYITTTATSGTLYLDDFSIREVPAGSTELLTTDLGEFDAVEDFAIEFSGEIDKNTLPENIKLNGTLVDSEILLSEDNKTATVSINEAVTPGLYTISFTCEDLWGRKIEVSVKFKIRGEDPNANYGNIFDTKDANCEDLENFSVNEYPTSDSPVVRTIDTSMSHTGDSSLKMIIPGNYRVLAGIVPTEKLIEGAKYTFSVWYYNPGTKTEHIYLRYATVTGHNISNWVTGVAHDTKTEMKNQAWTRFDYTFTATNKLASDLRYLYITSTATTGELYLDDFSLRRIPEEETTLTESDFGKYEEIEDITLEFTKELDAYSIPDSVMIDSTTVRVDAKLLEDGKSLYMEFIDPIAAGAHTMTVTLKDIWNRTVSANATFEVENISGGEVNIYANLINKNTAKCENMKEFEENAYTEPVERSIDNEIYHTGEGSLKTTFDGSYKPLASIKPNMAIIPGEEYYFSVWYYTKEETSNKKMYLRYSNHNNTTISNWITGVKFDSGVYMAKGQWAKYEFSFVATPELGDETFSNFYLTSELENGSIYFDDINLRLVSDEVVTLVGITPENNTENLSLGSSVCLEFTGEADSTDVDAVLYVNGEIDESGILCKNDDNILSIQPKLGWIPDCEYKLVINKINNVYGKKILENQEISFKTAHRLSFDVNFENADGSDIGNRIVLEDGMKAKFDVTNNNGIKTDFIAVVMVCEGQRVKKVYTSSKVSLNADDTVEDIEVELTDIPGGNNYVKVFLWSDATKSLRTLSEYKEFR